MTTTPRYSPLRDGLLLTTLHGRYRDTLPGFYKHVFTETYGNEDDYVDGWVGDIISGTHPTVTDNDVFIVIDPASEGRIVSATMLIPQLWQYAGLALPFGQVELVATHKDYRGRRLVRSAIDAAHARSQTLGHLATGIIGIPHFYRRFGYSMSVKMGTDSALTLDSLAPPEKNAPRYTLRPATEDDIPHLMDWYNGNQANYLLSVARDAAYWAYLLRPDRNPEARRHCLIVCDGETPVGYIILRNMVNETGALTCQEYVIGPQSSYLATYKDIWQGIKAFVGNLGRFTPPERPVKRIVFDNALHPSLRYLLSQTPGGYTRPDTYAWYMRVPDFEAFLGYIRPVLEARLANSAARHYTGQIKINFYNQTGLTIGFEGGQLRSVKAAALPFDSENAAFPWDMFVNLIFGSHSYADLHALLPDVWAAAEIAIVLDILFPKQPVWIIQVD
ncbi:MAG: GNAT family N-acetyltransferase [Anaerolineales bacterium]